MGIVRRTPGGFGAGLGVVAASVGGLLGGLYVWDRLSPVPGSWLIDRVFRRDDAAARRSMVPYVPDGVIGRTDLAYGPGTDERLDVWAPDPRFPARADASSAVGRPTVVWVHGGGWVSGSKEAVAPYLQILAAEGWTTIGLDYSLAPGARYPVPVHQVLRALAWIVEHAADLGVDRHRIVLAGDSAGAQIAGQVAALTTSPDHAAGLGLSPVLAPDDLVGAMLHCGPYSTDLLATRAGIPGWFVRTVGWAYTGTQDLAAPELREMSVVGHATPDFPPTLLSGGNADPLSPHGEALRDRLTELGVEVTSFFWPAEHEPALGHEFQFDLDLAEAREVLAASRAFLGRVGG